MTALLDRVLDGRSRLALALAGLLLLPAFFTPLWRIEMYAQQFPEGLELLVYPHKLVGGSGGQDLHEINVLNHYIGMQEIEQQNFPEMKWIPFALGIFVVLAARAAVFAKVGAAVDVLVLFAYFGLFSLYSFYAKLYAYGHDLDPAAPMTVPPFTPPVLGRNQLANFTVYSLPGWGTLCLLAFGGVLAAVIGRSWWQARRA